MDISPDDARRLEVVANNLPLWNGAQIAVDTALVSALRANGNAISHAAHFDGVALQRARRCKERTYPELLNRNGRVRLVVMTIEMGERCSSDALDFLRQLARAKARMTPRPLQSSVLLSWYRRWVSLLACAAKRAFAVSFLELPASQGHNLDGHEPFLGDVLADDRWSCVPACSRLQ